VKTTAEPPRAAGALVATAEMETKGDMAMAGTSMLAGTRLMGSKWVVAATAGQEE